MARAPIRIVVRAPAQPARAARARSRDEMPMGSAADDGEPFSQVRREVATYPGDNHRAEIETRDGQSVLVIFEITADIEPAVKADPRSTTADRRRLADSQRRVLAGMNARNAAFWGRTS